ncbi:MAG: VWA domain-containing protein [Candidatus Gracilibacteria bacterium]|nr:VWA domain-containing protein [Candidatus Gracilibacteria bacterium]
MQITNLNIITSFIFIALLGIIFFVGYKTYKKQLFFNKKYKLLSSSRFFYVKYIFLILSFFTVLISIFGLKIGDKKTKNANNGIDMTFVVDVSKSMNVADINDSKYAYTRLDVVKDSISKFVISHPSDRFGLIIFAGDAISTVPLTTDHDLFLTFLQNVDYRNLTKQGSDFEKALSLGVDRFNYSDDRSKAMIFISDGGDPEDTINKNNIIAISQKVKGITYFVVGVGTNAGGKIITGTDFFGRYNYQKYNGEYVISKINKTNLKEISQALNGEYYTVSDVGDLGNLNDSINKLAKKVIETDTNGQKTDGGRILAIISFLFFMMFLGMYLSPYSYLSNLWRKN